MQRNKIASEFQYLTNILNYIVYSRISLQLTDSVYSEKHLQGLNFSSEMPNSAVFFKDTW